MIKSGLGWPGMVACLVGPGPEEDILFLAFDFPMSSFGGGCLPCVLSAASLNNGTG